MSQGKVLKLALVGRPNVGKSALFNRICGKRLSIVDEGSGTTRDRLYAQTDLFGHTLEIIDTGGMDIDMKRPFQEEIRRQTEIAIEEADLLVMVVDGMAGILPLDEQVAKWLLREKKPVCLAINKMDHSSHLDQIHQFHRLGIQKMVPVSATQGYQIAELLETITEGITWPDDRDAVEEGIKVAIIGRTNVGKSTLVNAVLDEQRCVVSPIAGTTRDSIDVQFTADGQLFTLIDTAGIRRKSKEADAVEKFAAVRTERAIERADVCLLILDSEEGLTHQEKRIAAMIEEQGKGCLLLFNKWDLVKGIRMEHCLKTVQNEASFLSHCPTLFISAKTGRNLENCFPLIKKVHEEQTRRVTTGQLNKFLEKVINKVHPAMIQGKRLRIYYMAQVDVHPPRFILFVNYPNLMLDSYKQYMIHQFREEFGFSGSPVLFNLKARSRKQMVFSNPK